MSEARQLLPALLYNMFRIFAILACLVWCVVGRSEPTPCGVRAQTTAGWVCGVKRWADNGSVYASFRGVPYAKQPLGRLRFQELQPAEPWQDFLDASEEGPVCPQHDILYGPLIKPHGMSEACIFANVHVPLTALPPDHRLSRQLHPYHAAYSDEQADNSGLPVMVFIHGGGWGTGSGDSDLHGPEYLVSKGVVVITFNYRLNAFGFLSLNTTSVPGNMGLRDQITLLKWVKKNARSFGGNPDDVTIAGQSAGAVSAHLLTLSPAADGLFQRAILMSGTANAGFYSTSPAYSKYVADIFLAQLGINATDPEEVHNALVETPLEKIIEVVKNLQDANGLLVFTPVVESPLPGITRVLDDDPSTLIAKGRGLQYPLVVGYTNAECEIFRPRFEKLDMVTRITNNPLLMTPVSLLFSRPPDASLAIAKKIEMKYFKGAPTMNGFVEYCSDSYFVYPVMKLAETRSHEQGAPMFTYQFSYEGDTRVLQDALGIKLKKAAHVEDLTYVFRTNTILKKHDRSFPPRNQDDKMKDWLTSFFVTFMFCNDPSCSKNRLSAWPPSENEEVKILDMETPTFYRMLCLEPDSPGSEKLLDIRDFYDHLEAKS